jgi:hypothetical protein
MDYDIQSYARGGTCFLNSEYSEVSNIDHEKCIKADSDKTNVLLIGDSHSAHYYKAISELYPEAVVSQANASGCRPIINSNGKVRCVDLMHEIFSNVIPDNNFDVVILAGRWQKKENANYIKTVDYLLGYVQTVYFIGPIIEYVRPVPRILAFSDATKLSVSESKTLTNYESAKQLENLLFSSLGTAERSKHGLKLISPLDIFCPLGSCSMADKELVPYQFDYGHLTTIGAKAVMRELRI